MNRSFRAAEGGRERERERQQKVMRGNGTRREKEEELAMFLEMRKREKERNNLLFHGSEEFDAPLGSRPGTSPIFNIPSSAPTRRSGTDDFLNSENDKNDYEWLLTPPGTPLFPSLETESQRTVMSQIGSPKARPTSLKSRLANPQPELSTRTHLASRQTASAPGLNTSTIGLRRPSSSGGPGSRPSTPTSRPTLTSTSKPVSTHVSKSTSTISSRSTPLTTSKSMPSVSKSSSRSSTPTSRPTFSSTTKPTVVPPRSSTPTNRSTLPVSKPPSRSSTPTRKPGTLSTSTNSCPTLPVSKAPSRSSTPTRRPGTLSTSTNSCATLPVSKPQSRSSTPTRRPGILSTSTNSYPSSQNPAPPRASSPTVKPRWNPSEMPGFSLDAPPNLRTSLLDRPPSVTRGRPVTPGARSSSFEPSSASNGRVRRQSCSPSRGRQPNGIKNSYGSSVPAVSRIHAKANESVSPGLVGTKMVERVINMRRLVPPKHDDKQSPRSNLSGKSSSPDSSGFGRSFSKKSLDMAVRHMDIRKNMQGNMRPLMSNIPASSMYSVRSGPARSRTISVSDSPLATSSNASSEVSVNNNGFFVDGGELDDDINIERGTRSPPNICGR